MVSAIFNPTTRTLNWNLLNDLNQFKQLYETKQSVKRYTTENVGTYVHEVCCNMRECTLHLDNETATAMIMAALFHVIGKGNTTIFVEETEDWISPNYIKQSVRMMHKFFAAESIETRMNIEYFIANQNKLYNIVQRQDRVRELIRLSCEGFNTKICNIENLLLFTSVLTKHITPQKQMPWEDMKMFIQTLAINLNCLTKPYSFNNDMERFVYFNDSIEETPTEVKDKPVFNVYIQIGGSNKVELPSQDISDLRQCRQQDLTDLIIEHCENQDNFVFAMQGQEIESMDEVVNCLYLYHANIIFVYDKDALTFPSPTMCMSYSITT